MPLFCCKSSSVAVSPTLIMSSSPQTHTKTESNSPLTPSGSRSEMMVNDLVGKEFSGSLQKWVNYGKGWRRRWFVLQDGVLSYYKIHLTDRIDNDAESRKSSKVIGEESRRRLLHKQRSGLVVVGPKALGQIHLKVSTIRESRSDDKKFSIYTGTKMLHLRAETREDRSKWTEVLKAVKEMFPKILNSELMIPSDEFVISTKKLRQRLMEEGVSEVLIQDCERIVRSEFASLQTQLALLRHNHALLIDSLRHLEV